MNNNVNSPLTDMLKNSSEWGASYQNATNVNEEESNTKRIIDVVVNDEDARKRIKELSDEYAKSLELKIETKLDKHEDVLKELKEVRDFIESANSDFRINVEVDGLSAFNAVSKDLDQMQSKIASVQQNVLKFSDSFNELDASKISTYNSQIESAIGISKDAKKEAQDLVNSLNADIQTKNFADLTEKLIDLQSIMATAGMGGKEFNDIISSIGGEKLAAEFESSSAALKQLKENISTTVTEFNNFSKVKEPLENIVSTLSKQAEQMDKNLEKAKEINQTKIQWKIDGDGNATKLANALDLSSEIEMFKKQKKEIEKIQEELNGAAKKGNFIETALGGKDTGSGVNRQYLDRNKQMSKHINGTVFNTSNYLIDTEDDSTTITDNLSKISEKYGIYNKTLADRHKSFVTMLNEELNVLQQNENKIKEQSEEGLISSDEAEKAIEEIKKQRKALNEQLNESQKQTVEDINKLAEGNARLIAAAGENAVGNYSMMNYGDTFKSDNKKMLDTSVGNIKTLSNIERRMEGPKSFKGLMTGKNVIKNLGTQLALETQGVNVSDIKNIARSNAGKADFVNKNFDNIAGGLNTALSTNNKEDIDMYKGQLGGLSSQFGDKKDIKSLSKAAKMDTKGDKNLEGLKKAAQDQIAVEKQSISSLLMLYQQLDENGQLSDDQQEEMERLKEAMNDLEEATEENSDKQEKSSSSSGNLGSTISSFLQGFEKLLSNAGALLSTPLASRAMSMFEDTSLGKGISSFMEDKLGLTGGLDNIPTGKALEIALDPYKAYNYIGLSNFNADGYRERSIELNKQFEQQHFNVAQTNAKYGLSGNYDLAEDKAKELYRATNGVVGFEDLSQNYDAVAKTGIQDSKTAGQWAEYATLMDKVGAMDSSEVISTLKNLYTNMDLTAEKSVQMVNRIASAAKNSKVSVSDYAQAVTSIADGYRRVGLDADDALNVMGNLMDAGYSFKDAQEMASTFGNSLSTFSNNNSDVILSGLMSGGTDPYKMLADAQDVTDPNWGKNMASGMQSILDMKESMFGKGSNLAKYEVMKTMQTDFGFSQKQSAEMYHKLQDGDIGSLEDLLDEIANEDSGESIEEINSKLLDETVKLGGEVGGIQEMVAKFDYSAAKDGVEEIKKLESTLSGFVDSNINDMQEKLEIDYSEMTEYLDSKAGQWTQSHAELMNELSGSFKTIIGILCGLLTSSIFSNLFSGLSSLLSGGSSLLGSAAVGSAATIAAGGAMIAAGAAWGVHDANKALEYAQENGGAEGAAMREGFWSGSHRNEQGLHDGTNMAANAGKFALIGAGIGTFIPGVGTVVGGAIGAGVGAVLGSEVYDTYVNGNSREYNRIRSGYNENKNALTEKYISAGYSEEVAQTMSDGLYKFSSELKGQNSTTMDAFARYYAEAIASGKTPEQAISDFTSNIDDNVDKIITQMKEEGVEVTDENGIVTENGDTTQNLVTDMSSEQNALFDKWAGAANKEVVMKGGESLTLKEVVESISKDESTAEKAGTNDVRKWILGKDNQALASLNKYGGDYDKILEAATTGDKGAAKGLQLVQDALFTSVAFHSASAKKDESDAYESLVAGDRTLTAVRTGDITNYERQYVTQGEQQISKDIQDLKNKTVGSTDFNNTWNKYKGVIEQNPLYKQEYQNALKNGSTAEEAAKKAQEAIQEAIKDKVSTEDPQALSDMIGISVADAMAAIDDNNNPTPTSTEQSDMNKIYDLWAGIYSNGGNLEFVSDKGDYTANANISDIFKGFTQTFDENDTTLVGSIVNRNRDDIDYALEKAGSNTTTSEVLSKYMKDGNFDTVSFLENAKNNANSDEGIILKTFTNNMLPADTNDLTKYRDFKGMGTGEKDGVTFTGTSETLSLKRTQDMTNLVTNKNDNYVSTVDLRSPLNTKEDGKKLLELLGSKIQDKNGNGNYDELIDILEDDTGEQLQELINGNLDIFTSNEDLKKILDDDGTISQNNSKSILSFLKSIIDSGIKIKNITNGNNNNDGSSDGSDGGSGSSSGGTGATVEFKGNLDEYTKKYFATPGSTVDFWNTLLGDMGYSNGFASFTPDVWAENAYNNTNYSTAGTKTIDTKTQGTKYVTYELTTPVSNKHWWTSANYEIPNTNNQKYYLEQAIKQAPNSTTAGIINNMIKGTTDYISNSELLAINQLLAKAGTGVQLSVSAGASDKLKAASNKPVRNLVMTKAVKEETTTQQQVTDENNRTFNASELVKSLIAGHIYSLNNYTVGTNKNGEIESTSLRILRTGDDSFMIGSYKYSDSAGTQIVTNRTDMDTATLVRTIQSGYADTTNKDIATLTDLTGDISSKLSEVTRETTPTTTPEETTDPEEEQRKKEDSKNMAETAKNTGDAVDALNGTGYLGAGQLLFTAQTFGSNSSLSGQSLATTDWEGYSTSLTEAGGGLVAPDAQILSYALATSSEINSYATLNKNLQENGSNQTVNINVKADITGLDTNVEEMSKNVSEAITYQVLDDTGVTAVVNTTIS